MNFLERVISNYFLAWSQVFMYEGKSSRIQFWHFFFLDGLIGFLINFYSSITYYVASDDFYSLNSSIEWPFLYSFPSFFVFLALAVRRLRDSGKKNLVLWTFCSLIPLYNLYLFSRPSSVSEVDSNPG